MRLAATGEPRRLLFVLPLLLLPHAAAAQGGPPLVTDDPGTPGNRHWEVNVAFVSESRGSERTLETPLIDANYGLGARWKIGKHVILFASGGAGIKDIAQEPRTKLQTYVGLQLPF